MTKKKLLLWTSNVLMGILFTIIAIALALLITINFKPLFYFDIDHLGLVEFSGYSEEIIIRNYDEKAEYVIRYNVRNVLKGEYEVESAVLVNPKTNEIGFTGGDKIIVE